MPNWCAQVDAEVSIHRLERSHRVTDQVLVQQVVNLPGRHGTGLEFVDRRIETRGGCHCGRGIFLLCIFLNLAYFKPDLA